MYPCQSTKNWRDSRGANSIDGGFDGISRGPSIVSHGFREMSLPSDSVTTSRAEMPTVTGESEMFFNVTVISNGTPGRTVSYGSVSVASTGAAAVAARPANATGRRRANATLLSFMSFMSISFMEQTGPGACGFPGTRNA